MEDKPATIAIEYNKNRLIGRLVKSGDHRVSSIWEHLKARFVNVQDTIVTDSSIETPWPNILDAIRELGTRQFQQSMNFRFLPIDIANEKLKDFARQVSETKQSRNTLIVSLSFEEIHQQLSELGFKRKLRPFQLRDVQKLISLSNGANFSVPGAGKTTVTFAIYLLTRKPKQHLFVVAPKAAFPAWKEIIDECITEEASNDVREKFTMLDSSESETNRLLNSGATRFIISYDLMVRQQATISAYMAKNAVHLVLDESHRMKAGLTSQRGAFLINVSSLPVRRDILSGTPMPQGPNDIASQLRFLWPGTGLDLRILRGETPRNVLGHKYVRTTKNELGLPPSKRFFYNVDMAPGQLALYSVVKDETLRQLSKAINNRGNNPDYLSARKSVMRLLQLSTNPTLALQSIIKDDMSIVSGIVDKVIEEGVSNKMLSVVSHARKLAKEGKKVVIWTIFTGSILDLENLLADLNPVSLYGAINSGDSSDLTTREGRILRFHKDPACMVLIANPSAAGEGISLHTVCHEAIYLDRSYVSTHFLQSIDRIHRLGLPSDVETNIHIYRTKAPANIGSIDLSVSRRLAAKIDNLQQLLDDPDLHEIALDEDGADEPTDYNIDLQDLVDLVSELEGESKNTNSEEA